MSSQLPPDPYFNNINFNPSFFIDSDQQFLTETTANLKYLKLTGGTISGYLGIGNINPIANLAVSGNSQLEARILLSGQEFLSPSFNSSNGIALLVGVNRTNNRQLWIADSGNLTQNTTNAALTLSASNGQTYISSISTNGLTNLPVNITGSSLSIAANTNITSNLGIGTATTPLATLHIVEPIGTAASANTGTIIIDHNNNGGASSILFRSSISRGSDFGYIQYQDAATVGGAGEAAKLIIGTQNDNTDDIILLPSGNVGIGSNTPQTKLDINGKVIISDAASGLPANGILGGSGTELILKIGTPSATPIALGLDTDNLWIGTNTNGGVLFFTGTTERMRVNSNGRIGIGITNPATILQIGSGERLRISNDNNDFTIIGTSDTGGFNNTSITLSGSSRSGPQTGNIEHTAVNFHRFYTTSGSAFNERLTIKNDGNVGIGSTNPTERLTVVGNISLSSGTYRNGGFSIAFSGKFRNGVGFINGYFIDPVDYNNSLMICAFSHDSISYQVWNGRISVNKNSAVTDVTNFYAPNSMTVDAFIEATTLKSWIYINPVAAYNSSTNLFAKIYG